MSTKPVDQNATGIVPAELAGKWVAWSADHKQIVAHAATIPELWHIVHDRKIANPIFEKAPRWDVRLIGMR